MRHSECLAGYELVTTHYTQLLVSHFAQMHPPPLHGVTSPNSVTRSVRDRDRVGHMYDAVKDSNQSMLKSIIGHRNAHSSLAAHTIPHLHCCCPPARAPLHLLAARCKPINLTTREGLDSKQWSKG